MKEPTIRRLSVPGYYWLDVGITGYLFFRDERRGDLPFRNDPGRFTILEECSTLEDAEQAAELLEREAQELEEEERDSCSDPTAEAAELLEEFTALGVTALSNEVDARATVVRNTRKAVAALDQAHAACRLLTDCFQEHDAPLFEWARWLEDFEANHHQRLTQASARLIAAWRAAGILEGE